MRRASLAPDTRLYSGSSVAARFRCDEPFASYVLAAAATSAHHQLHHAHHTTSFKPSAGFVIGGGVAGPSSSSTASGSGSSAPSSSAAAAMVYHHHQPSNNNTNSRRRSLPLRSSHQRSSIVVGGQIPAHRSSSRRASLVGAAAESRLNSAQHPHVAPIYDPKIQLDDRTLNNLKETERDTILTGPTFLKCSQTEVAPAHRATVVQWMRDVLCEEASEEEVFPLAVLILDNYLSIENILLRDVQGIAAACMLMASKMKAPAPINATRLSFFTENSVSSAQIVNFELLILRTLKWQIALPTAFDFADQVFCRVPSLRELKPHFVRALYDMQQNVKDAVCRPSIQAAVALARAARALAAPPALLEHLRLALAAHLDFDLAVALRMGGGAAPAAPVTPSADSAPESDAEEDEDAAFAASSLAYTPVREEQPTLLQPAAAAVAVVGAPRAKSPPVTPPSGTDSGFCSAQGTPEAGAESDSRPPSSPF